MKVSLLMKHLKNITVMIVIALLFSGCASKSVVNSNNQYITSVDNKAERSSKELAEIKVDFTNFDKMLFIGSTEHLTNATNIPVMFTAQNETDKRCLLNEIRFALVESIQSDAKKYIKNHSMTIDSDIAFAQKASIVFTQSLSDIRQKVLNPTAEMSDKQAELILKNGEITNQLFTNPKYIDLMKFLFDLDFDTKDLFKPNSKFINTIETKCHVSVNPKLYKE